MFYSLSCALLWAATGIFVKLIQGLDVNQIIFFRFLIALGCGLCLLRRLRFRRGGGAGPMQLPVLMSLYYICATYGFYLAPVAIAALLISVAPLFTLILKIGNRQPYHANEPIGFCIALLGLAGYFSLSGTLAGQDVTAMVYGGGCALLAALLRAIFSYQVWRKGERGEEVNVYQINLETLALGALLLLPLMVWTPPAGPLDLLSLASLLGLGLLATLVPNLLNNLASMKIDPTTHNLIGMSTPLAASLMAWLWLGEAQSPVALLCMGVTVLGIYVSIRKPGPGKTVVGE